MRICPEDPHFAYGWHIASGEWQRRDGVDIREGLRNGIYSLTPQDKDGNPLPEQGLPDALENHDVVATRRALEALSREELEALMEANGVGYERQDSHAILLHKAVAANLQPDVDPNAAARPDAVAEGALMGMRGMAALLGMQGAETASREELVEMFGAVREQLGTAANAPSPTVNEPPRNPPTAAELGGVAQTDAPTTDGTSVKAAAAKQAAKRKSS